MRSGPGSGPGFHFRSDGHRRPGWLLASCGVAGTTIAAGASSTGAPGAVRLAEPSDYGAMGR